MRILYHLPLDPFSRKIRIVLNEKKIDAELTVEQFWDRREGFLALSFADAGTFCPRWSGRRFAIGSFRWLATDEV